MCNQDGNTNKVFCIPPNTYLSFFSVSDNPGYLVRCTTPPWAYPLWCDDLHFSGAYMCFSPKEDSSVCPSLVLLRTRAHHLRMIIY